MGVTKDLMIMNFIALHIVFFLAYWAATTNLLATILITLTVLGTSCLTMYGYSRLSERLQNVVFDIGGRVILTVSVIALIPVLLLAFITLTTLARPTMLIIILPFAGLILVWIALSAMID